ncbi:translation initiation factor IF-2 [Fodinibius salsisoli]|uniref:Translation initiation factor IF-2 n=1 Tax=Fodinibius salsisoli TaxID=2820877 RepID=A0ABT3PSV7_9BACT|nr:translation initiation factor IF-2 [Fodinibius salsisoli]MCW9708926.1 translation initiation factor IF-2 [Fodinibius salsisoli]
MSPKKKPKRLFKVASEFNVSTTSIVDSLSEEGFDVTNKPNTKVTPEMYEVLEEVYGVDKANSQQHAKAKEDYASRRDQIRSSRNESVSIEDSLEPLEDDLPLEPEEDLPLEPEEEEEPEEIGGLEPIEGEEEEDTPEEEIESEEESQPEEKEEQPESVEEVEAEEKEETPEEKEEDTQPVSEEIEEEEPEPEEDVEPDPVAAETEEDQEDADVVEEEEDTQEQAEEPQTAEVSDSEEVDHSEEVEGETDEGEDTSDVEVEEEEADEEEEDTQPVSEEIEEEEPQSEEDDEPESAEVEKEESDDEDEADEDEEEETREQGVIRGRAGRLKGTKVVGKVTIDDSKPKRRKKRKRKKDRRDEDEGSNTKSAKREKKKGKKKKKRRKRRGSRVDDEDVEQKMKETLRKMQSSETVGSRRQKRRKQRKEEREEEEQLQAELEELEEGLLEVTEFITVSDLAELMDVKANEVITTCMNLGMMVSINQRLDASTIELVAEEFNYEVEFVDAEEAIEEIELEEDDPEDLRPRAPIITVMGHVDHGKTSLLDYIRKSQVAEGEAGGITQHVGAYEVKTDDGRPITFLDTPGHEAFTAMRSRGAQATDIVILVVAADDAVMPQTIEAINHAKAAGVSIIVAINKMDKPGAKPEKIKQQLAEHDVIVEEYGGTNQAAEVSAKTGEGIPELLEKVLIESELMELKANPDRKADGVVLEARVDKGKGTVANILVQNGTLRVGDSFVAGPCFGRVRAMENELGNRVEAAGPSEPVQLTGFDDIPQAGDKIVVLEDEKKAKEIASQRQQIRREQELRQSKHLSLDDLSRRLALGEVSDLNLIIKADVDGSIEALSGSLQKLSNDEVSVNIVHKGAGAITESDVLLASASDAIIIGFQVRPTSNARSVADNEEIDIRLFSVIYDAVDEVKDAMEGMLSPEISEKLLGNAEVREIFKVSSVGTIAGCYVTDGKVNRNNPVRIVRDGVVIYDGEIDSLKRFKDDVKEVQTGYECGLSIVNYNDLKVGDVIENYEVIEERRSLEDVKGND